MSWDYLNYRQSRSRLEHWAAITLLLLIVGFVVAMSLPPLLNDRNGGRSELAYRLKSVSLSVYNFNDTFNQFSPHLPGGTTDLDVKKPVSYFTSLLPFLEQARLYERIDKGVAWTHPKNRDAYGARVKTFEWPEDQQPYYENEKTAAGYAIVHFSPSSRLISRSGAPLRIEDFTDGKGETIILGTIDDSNVPAWGDPRNARDPANGFAGGPDALGGFPEGEVFPDGAAYVAFADGHVRTVSAGIDPKVAKALATPGGGEVVGDY